jgi:COX assembly protein 1
MSFYDKSDRVGYDMQDLALNEELEEMLLRTPPQVQRHLQQRIHDAITQRMKEESTRKCWEFIKKYEQCMNTHRPTEQPAACGFHRDALNDCAHEVNREENYQRYRIMYLRGELQKLHEQRTFQRVETMKRAAPDIIQTWKTDYTPRYADLVEDITKEK